MQEPAMADTRAPTTDQIRFAIEHGHAGDKVDFPDPATAPLGTDAEAGGTPPTPAERRLEAASLGPKPKKSYFQDVNGVVIYCAAAIPVVLVILGLAAWA
jgi:hypothetical protein